MASLTSPALPWIILIVLLTVKIFQILCDPLDTAPNELGIDGKQTPSAKYGWNLMLRDISRSWKKTKIYQKTKGKNDHVGHIKSSKGYYSPKRSSKCVFGIPDPEQHCGPEVIAKIFTKEYMKYALTLWKPYGRTRSYRY